MVTAIVYVGAALWFAYQLPADELIANPYAMREIASVPALILAGVAASHPVVGARQRAGGAPDAAGRLP